MTMINIMKMAKETGTQILPAKEAEAFESRMNARIQAYAEQKGIALQTTPMDVQPAPSDLELS